ncbi:MAG TPA: creatininase family protein, partial [Polyangia bacterium]
MRRLGALTWRDAEALKARAPIALVPIGSTEAHGPHLPLATDAILSEELAERAAAALDAAGYTTIVAPTVAYAITHYASEFAGTISIAPATATALVADVCASLIAQGFGRVCLVNSHLEPAHVASLKAACARVEQRTGRRVAFPDKTERRWARTLT